jgi:small subunit ribosomal protein S6
MEERLYDLIFIARPATAEEDVKKVLAVIEHACTEKGGKIEKAETWGTRKLAYKVAKHREGMYYYQQIRTSHPDLISELERRLRVQDTVIKYQTVRLDEDLKRQKKLVDRREKRAARRPRRATTPAATTHSAPPSAAPPSAPPPPAPAAPESAPTT